MKIFITHKTTGLKDEVLKKTNCTDIDFEDGSKDMIILKDNETISQCNASVLYKEYNKAYEDITILSNHRFIEKLIEYFPKTTSGDFEEGYVKGYTVGKEVGYQKGLIDSLEDDEPPFKVGDILEVLMSVDEFNKINDENYYHAYKVGDIIQVLEVDKTSIDAYRHSDNLSQILDEKLYSTFKKIEEGWDDEEYKIGDYFEIIDDSIFTSELDVGDKMKIAEITNTHYIFESTVGIQICYIIDAHKFVKRVDDNE